MITKVKSRGGITFFVRNGNKSLRLSIPNIGHIFHYIFFDGSGKHEISIQSTDWEDAFKVLTATLT